MKLNEARIAVIDTETTGLDPVSDRIVEIGVATGRLDAWPAYQEWLVHPGREIPLEAAVIHGITDAMVAGAQPYEEIIPLIDELLAGCDVVAAYNWPFDRAFMVAGALRANPCGFRWPCCPFDFDVLTAYRRLFKFARGKRLCDAMNQLGIPASGFHRVQGDIYGTWAVFARLAGLGCRRVGDQVVTFGEMELADLSAWWEAEAEAQFRDYAAWCERSGRPEPTKNLSVSEVVARMATGAEVTSEGDGGEGR